MKSDRDIAAECSDEAKHHCNDELNNDEDGYVDDADPDCASGYEELGFGETQCNDGIDNNGDGTLDAEDSNCESAADGSNMAVGISSIMMPMDGLTAPTLIVPAAVQMKPGLTQTHHQRRR